MIKDKESILKLINSSDKENGYVAARILRYDNTLFSEKDRVKLLKKINICDRIHTLEDIYNELKLSEENVLLFKDPKNSNQRYLNSCSIIPRIVEVYNEGTILDWNDSNQRKYLPYLKKVGSAWVFYGGSGWISGSDGPSGHHYKDIDLLKDGCEKFKFVYTDYFNV